MLHALPHEIMWFFFPAAMALAAASDLFAMKIPNLLCAVLAAGYFVIAWFAGVPLAEIGMHALCGAVMLGVTFALFVLGPIGGGDAKLISATALWLGWSSLADYGLAFSLVGGGLAIFALFARHYILPDVLASQGWIVRLHTAAKTHVPYGIALAIGGLIAYPQTQLWSQLAAG